MVDKSLIAQVNPKSPISEAYRILRTNIQFSSDENPMKLIVVTSAGPREGKSTTIANLAITFAQLGSKVLLVDADLRKPSIHKKFDLNNSVGLVNILTRPDDYKKAVQSFMVNKLDIITSGPIPPNPSELIGSNSMKKFINRVKEEYDMVFIDAPPLGPVTDAAILASISDGTILVAASGQVQIDAIRRAKELLEQVKAKIVGVVLNKIDININKSSYYYYYEDGLEASEPIKLNNNQKKKVV